MIAALLLASIGLKAVFDSHNLAEPQMPNLYTLHSWIGLAAVIFFAMQVSFELTSFTYKVAVGSTSSASKLRSCTVAVGVRCVPVSRSAPFAALVLHAAARLWRPHDIRLGDRRSHQRTLGKGHFYKVQSQNKWIVDILWLAYLFVSYIRSAYTLLGATTEGILINCIGLSVAALSVVIIYIATRWQYKRQPLPEDELLLADQLAEWGGAAEGKRRL